MSEHQPIDPHTENDPPTEECILRAAMERFAHYGFHKTTMAEIATDCTMSAGNLYRYFPGKMEIAAAIAERYTDHIGEQLRETLRAPGLSPTERLRTYLMKELELTFVPRDTSDKIFELAQMIHAERKDVLDKQRLRTISDITEILSMGNASGDFDIANVADAAEAIYEATVVFRHSYINTQFDRAKLERRLAGVCQLLCQGISVQPKRA